MADEGWSLTNEEVQEFIALLVELASPDDATTSDDGLWRVALTEEPFDVLRQVVEP